MIAGDAARDAGDRPGEGAGGAAEGGDPTLDAADARDLADVFADISIAPLGRNYFGRYREIRESLKALAGEADTPVASARVREHLDEEDVEFMDAILRNLRNFADEGYRREGEVEPYLSARADVERLEPLLDLLRPHFPG